MPSYVKEARVFINEDNKSSIEIKYTRYVEGRGYVNYPDYFEAEAVGEWQEIDATGESIRYEEFLRNHGTENHRHQKTYGIDRIR